MLLQVAVPITVATLTAWMEQAVRGKVSRAQPVKGCSRHTLQDNAVAAALRI
jgi:hypothetical protein